MASHTPSAKQREGLRRLVTVVPTGESSSSPGSHLAQGTKVSAEDDKTNESIAQAMSLLLAARERVLTLSEQRVGPLFKLIDFILTCGGDSYYLQSFLG
jgi:hypothetical protein